MTKTTAPAPATPKNKAATRILRYVYTDKERLEIGKTLGQVHADLGNTNADFDRVKAEFKSKITAHEAKLTDLAHKVSSGYDMRDTKCEWTFDSPKKGHKTLRRLDTDEVVETAEMSQADFQQEIALETENGKSIDGSGVIRTAADGPAEPGDGKK